MSLGTAITFATVAPGLLIAHSVADHWIQTGYQAANKSLPGARGRAVCAAHVGTYTVVTAAVVGLLWFVFALPISGFGFVVGQLISAVTHYWADRKTTLARLCELFERAGKGDFYRLGQPREGHDDNPSLGTGAYALDQSWHWAWLGVAALLTAVIP